MSRESANVHAIGAGGGGGGRGRSSEQTKKQKYSQSSSPSLVLRRRRRLDPYTYSQNLRYFPDGLTVEYKGLGAHAMDWGTVRAAKEAAFQGPGGEGEVEGRKNYYFHHHYHRKFPFSLQYFEVKVLQCQE